MKGYVYVLVSLNSVSDQCEYFKIGVSQNSDISTRVKSLQTGSPGKIEIVSAIELNAIKTAYVLEKHFHWRFKECRSHGEWFHITPALKEFSAKGIFDYGEVHIKTGPTNDVPVEPSADEVREFRKSFFAKLLESVGGNNG